MTTSSGATSSGTTSSGTTLVLHNPLAGGGRSAEVWQRLLRRVPELADAEPVRAASPEGALEALVQRLGGDDVAKAFALGGDGTVHMLVNGLMQAGRYDVAFGVVPAGSGSDFARHLGLPMDSEPALRHVLAADPASARPIDVIEVETISDENSDENPVGERRYSINIASAGLSGAVNQAVERARDGRDGGGGGYLWATLQTLFRYRHVDCTIHVDGEPFHEGPMWLVAMANGSSFGSNMRVAPDAVDDDGLLDVVFVPPVPKWQLPLRMHQFVTGRHVRADFVRTTRAKEVVVRPRGEFLPYDLDGESMEPEPATFRILPKKLRVLD